MKIVCHLRKKDLISLSKEAELMAKRPVEIGGTRGGRQVAPRCALRKQLREDDEVLKERNNQKAGRNRQSPQGQNVMNSFGKVQWKDPVSVRMFCILKWKETPVKWMFVKKIEPASIGRLRGYSASF